MTFRVKGVNSNSQLGSLLCSSLNTSLYSIQVFHTGLFLLLEIHSSRLGTTSSYLQVNRADEILEFTFSTGLCYPLLKEVSLSSTYKVSDQANRSVKLTSLSPNST